MDIAGLLGDNGYLLSTRYSGYVMCKKWVCKGYNVSVMDIVGL